MHCSGAGARSLWAGGHARTLRIDQCETGIAVRFGRNFGPREGRGMTKETSVIHPRSRPAASTPGTKLIRILVADDHLVYRIGIRNLLGSEPGFDVIGEAS